MIWHYFPIGMRFPVADFSDETKRDCWRIALSAIFSADPCGTGLYEACESFDPVSQSPVYTCIVCYVGIRQSRVAGARFHALDALTTRLCLDHPLVQANYLESFGPYPILAEINTEGKIVPSENAAFIPTDPVVPMTAADGWKLLIVASSENGTFDAERVTRAFGTAAAEHGFRVRRTVIADGSAGTVRALIAGTGGRYETAALNATNGDRISRTIGVLPGCIAVIEATDRESTFPVGQLIKKTLDLGYRKIWTGLGGSAAPDMGLGALAALGVRFFDADGEPVDPCAEPFDRIVRIDRENLDPRIAQTELTLLYDTAAPLPDGRLAALLGGDPNKPGSGAGNGLGFALASIGGSLQNGPECIFERIGVPSLLAEAGYALIAGKISSAEETLLRRYANPDGVVFCPVDEAPNEASVESAFRRTVLPAIG
ncbi:MAG: glycerate kinase [Clostridia bacterium]|nr:glycerate kinase [Clostridia bacterium]